MKFKFITVEERRRLIAEATERQGAITFVHFGARRFISDNDVICLVRGEDEIIGETPPPQPLTIEESQRVVGIIMANTQ